MADIAGYWPKDVDGGAGVIDVTDPATGGLIGWYGPGNAADVQGAAKLADHPFCTLATPSGQGREAGAALASRPWVGRIVVSRSHRHRHCSARRTENRSGKSCHGREKRREALWSFVQTKKMAIRLKG